MDKKAKLITENAELLIYLDGKLHITILGGVYVGHNGPVKSVQK